MSAAGRSEAAPPRTAGEVLARGREFLARKRLAEARLEAELLVAHALGLDRLRLFLRLDQPVEAEEVERARGLLMRRAQGEPTAYLTGRREFYGRAFEVTPAVLIPRPETELLVDRARELLALRPPEARSVADIGTGSGCIAITLSLEVPGARVTALELSPAALEVARRNAERLQAAVELLAGDGPEALPEARFDLIASNPPYVLPEERAALAPQVRDFEPALALFLPEGDPDHWLRRLLESAYPRLAPGGTLLVELGASQGARATQLCAARGLQARVHPDLAGLPRLLEVPR